VVRVVEVRNNKVHIDRPLRTDVKVEWQPKLSSYNATVKHVGIEDFTIEFPNKLKNRHLMEKGYNPIMLNDVSNSWVKNSKITNADNAINLKGARFCEVKNVIINST
jgi:hypothetical protein